MRLHIKLIENLSWANGIALVNQRTQVIVGVIALEKSIYLKDYTPQLLELLKLEGIQEGYLPDLTIELMEENTVYKYFEVEVPGPKHFSMRLEFVTIIYPVAT